MYRRYPVSYTHLHNVLPNLCVVRVLCIAASAGKIARAARTRAAAQLRHSFQYLGDRRVKLVLRIRCVEIDALRIAHAQRCV